MGVGMAALECLHLGPVLGLERLQLGLVSCLQLRGALLGGREQVACIAVGFGAVLGLERVQLGLMGGLQLFGACLGLGELSVQLGVGFALDGRVAFLSEKKKKEREEGSVSVTKLRRCVLILPRATGSGT